MLRPGNLPVIIKNIKKIPNMIEKLSAHESRRTDGSVILGNRTFLSKFACSIKTTWHRLNDSEKNPQAKSPEQIYIPYASVSSTPDNLARIILEKIIV